MLPIRVQFVNQDQQKYATVGDYGEDEQGIWFKITRFPGKPAYSVAILLHEIAEYYRCKQDGVALSDIDAFDYGHPELDDPGLSPSAPYHKQHMESDVLERQFIINSGEDWAEYEAEIDNLLVFALGGAKC